MSIRFCVIASAVLFGVACHDIKDPPEPEGVQKVSFAPEAPLADGATVVTLTLSMNPAVLPADKKIVLTTTAGTFLGATATVNASVNEAGVAYAQLKAPSSPGKAIVSMTAAAVTSYTEIVFAQAPSNDGILKVTATPSTQLADGASTIAIDVAVDTTPRPAAGTKVSLGTTAGTFLGGTTSNEVPVNDSGLAHARLKAPAEPAVALLTATMGGTTRFSEILFTPAPPTEVRVTTSAFSTKAGAENAITVTATLVRTSGTPSAGVTVTFTADIPGGTTGEFGQFSPRSATSTSSTATSQFTAGATPYRGPVIIRAVATRDGVSVVGTATVTITQ